MSRRLAKADAARGSHAVSIESLTNETITLIERAVRVQAAALKPALLTGCWAEQVRVAKDALEHGESFAVNAERRLAEMLKICTERTDNPKRKETDMNEDTREEIRKRLYEHFVRIQEQVARLQKRLGPDVLIPEHCSCHAKILWEWLIAHEREAAEETLIETVKAKYPEEYKLYLDTDPWNGLFLCIGDHALCGHLVTEEELNAVFEHAPIGDSEA
jgi:hypothetical protein